MMNSNWKEDELKLTLELYLSKDLDWLSKMTEKTEEVVGLSQLLKHLNINSDSKSLNNRSCESILMKLAIFKSLDNRYEKSSPEDISLLDEEIWNKYYDKYEKLYAECCCIVERYIPNETNNVVTHYLERYKDKKNVDINEEFCRFAKKTYKLALEYRTNALSQQKNRVSKKIADTCTEIINLLRWCQIEEEYETNNIKEHGGINQIPIDDEKEKIGIHVKNMMCKLISEKKITQKMLDDMVDLEWSRETLHLGHPFLIQIDMSADLRTQRTDKNGHLRYWKDIYVIRNHEYYICKEWYESGRAYFDKWVSSIYKTSNLNMTEEQLVRILNYIKQIDEDDIYIKHDELYKKMGTISDKESILAAMVNIGLLAPFQNSQRKYIVEDYDLLFKMIEQPQKFI